MKYFIILILAIIVSVPSWAKRDKDYDYKYPDFIMPNGNQTVYFIDSIYIDNYVLVRSGINAQWFVITDSTYQLHKRPQKFWEQPNAIIYYDDISMVFDYYEPIPNDIYKSRAVIRKIWPYKWEIMPQAEPNSYGKRDGFCSFPNGKPTLFGMFLITGNAYNRLSCYSSIDDNRFRPIDFKNPYAYYCVVIPIR